MRAFAARYLAPGFLVRDPFDNLAALEGVEAPVLVLHGRRDRVVPYEHGEAVAEAAGAKLITFDGAGHNDVPVMSAAHRGPVEGHLRAAGML